MLGVAGCNDDPSPVGSEYLPQTVDFKTYVVAANEYEISSGQAVMSNATSQGATTMLVGRAPDGTVAHSLIAITDPITVLEGPTPREVTSAVLTFRTIPYRFGDLSNRQTMFDVVVLDEVALDSIRWSESLSAKIDASVSLGSFNGTLPDSAVVSVPLDRASTAQFLREYYTYDTTITTVSGKSDTVIALETRKTLALRARGGSRVIAAIVGATFVDVADSLKPQLVITMGDSTAALKAGVSSWVADVPVQTGANRIVVAGGEPLRTFIQVNPLGLPPGATIHQAQLEIMVDTGASAYGTSGVTSYVALYDADETSKTSLLATPLGRLMSGYRTTQSDSSFTALFELKSIGPSITTAVRKRRESGSGVAPFVLAMGRGSGGRADLESSTVDRLVFHGPDDVDPAKRPKLTIIYSTQVDAP